MKNTAITLTVVARMTSNYGEGLGNISSVQKVFRDGKTFSSRSRESVKNALMIQSGFYDDLQVDVDKVTQKRVNEEKNAANCRGLEGGYMSTSGLTRIRKSSFYLTDAVSCDEFVNETRFHNNLYLASTYAKQEGLNVQNDAGKVGLMPYQYEYEKSLKQYSMTIDLDKIGVDENYGTEATAEEKASRVKDLLRAVEHLNLVVKGNLDNAEPIFIVGGLSPYKTHYFENVVKVKNGQLLLSDELKNRLAKSFTIALLPGENLVNEAEIRSELSPLGISEFFDDLCRQVDVHFGV